MRRWLTHLTIVGYLATLSWGVVSHTLGFGTSSHPAMYYVVWDMFCGWSAWSTRTYILAEGESGTYYELAPHPWGEFHPFGQLNRHHYDPYHNFCVRMALNCLKNTRHEPITRILIVEEVWSKKFNDSPATAEARWSQPPSKYYHLRYAFDSNGLPLTENLSWIGHQSALAMAKNPRLLEDARRGRPFLALEAPNAYASPSSRDLRLNGPSYLGN